MPKSSPLARRLIAMREGVNNRVLIFDVERLPGITRQYWWDRGDLKNRYVHYESVERTPRTTICWCGETPSLSWIGSSPSR